MKSLAMSVTSPDLEHGARLGDRHSADGGNVAPRLTIAGIPDEALELAVIVHDPDAPMPHGFTHWVRYGIPAVDGDIALGVGRDGPNSTGRPGWYGPQPPVGHGDHHYYFWVYALRAAVEGEPTREGFLERSAPDIVAQARLVGLFSR
jgi:Raf kinase inhibitor-like YbhB/YbcL family protein